MPPEVRAILERHLDVLEGECALIREALTLGPKVVDPPELPTRDLDWAAALDAMKAGKAVARAEWKGARRLHLGDHVPHYTQTNEKGATTSYVLSPAELAARDWCVVDGPGGDAK